MSLTSSRRRQQHGRQVLVRLCSARCRPSTKLRLQRPQMMTSLVSSTPSAAPPHRDPWPFTAKQATRILVYAKRCFYAAANGLFGKLLNLASGEIILELVRTKCIPILLYGLECFQLGKADRRSLDFTFNRLYMKLFWNWEHWCSKRLSELLSYWSAELCDMRDGIQSS